MRAPHIDPQIENRHCQQDERRWKDQRGNEYLPGLPAQDQVQVIEGGKDNCPRNITTVRLKVEQSQLVGIGDSFDCVIGLLKGL